MGTMVFDIYQRFYPRHNLPHRDVRRDQVLFLRLAEGLFCTATLNGLVCLATLCFQAVVSEGSKLQFFLFLEQGFCLIS